VAQCITAARNFVSAPMSIRWELLALTPPGWGWVLLNGLLASVEIAAGAYLLALLIGIGGSFGKVYGGPITRDLLECYTTVVRAVPELVLILIIYYPGSNLVAEVSAAMGFPAVVINGVAAGIVVLGIVQGGFAIEVMRGAINAVPSGEIEAAQAFGMSQTQLLRRIILPAMLPHALPGLSNLWLLTTKDTALLAVVGFSELTLVTRQAGGATKAYFLFFCAAGVLYLMVTLISNRVIARIERWARRGMPSVAHHG
jgi:polar amino acid transport system permease protein